MSVRFYVTLPSFIMTLYPVRPLTPWPGEQIRIQQGTNIPERLLNKPYANEVTLTG